jgi:hypothetical protein
VLKRTSWFHGDCQQWEGGVQRRRGLYSPVLEDLLAVQQLDPSLHRLKHTRVKRRQEYFHLQGVNRENLVVPWREVVIGMILESVLRKYSAISLDIYIQP